MIVSILQVKKLRCRENRVAQNERGKSRLKNLLRAAERMREKGSRGFQSLAQQGGGVIPETPALEENGLGVGEEVSGLDMSSGRHPSRTVPCGVRHLFRSVAPGR